jgi:hypothetical protein
MAVPAWLTCWSAIRCRESADTAHRRQHVPHLEATGRLGA